jgi:hypothetical protein
MRPVCLGVHEVHVPNFNHVTLVEPGQELQVQLVESLERFFVTGKIVVNGEIGCCN